MSLHTIELVAVGCIYCHAYFGIGKEADEALHKSRKSFTCPYCRGEMHYTGKTAQQKKIQSLERDNKQKTLVINRLNNRANDAENSLRTTKGHLTRAKRKLGEEES